MFIPGLIRQLIPPLRRGILGELISGAFSAAGQASANSANANQADRANIFSRRSQKLQQKFGKKMARKQQQFQKKATRHAMRFAERMASTQHQRQVRDLRKAGLNPILSARLGGSAAPSVAAPSGSTASSGAPQGAQARMENVAAAGFSATNLARQTSAQVDVAKAQETNIKKDTDLKDKQILKTEEEAKKINQETSNLYMMGGKIQEETLTEIERRNNISQDTTLKIAQTYEASNRIDLIKSQFKLNGTQLELLKLQIPGLQVDAELAKSDVAIIYAHAEKISKIAGPLLHLLPAAVLGKVTKTLSQTVKVDKAGNTTRSTTQTTRQ